MTDLQGPFQGTHGRSSRRTAAGLKALPRLGDRQGDMSFQELPHCSQRRGGSPAGAARVEQAGGKTFLFPSIWIILKCLKNKKEEKRKERN